MTRKFWPYLAWGGFLLAILKSVVESADPAQALMALLLLGAACLLSLGCLVRMAG